MSYLNLIRLGGLAPIVGGALYAVASFLNSEGIQLVTFVLGLLSVMAVIVALHLLQRERYGLPGTLAFVTAFVGVVLVLGAFAGFPRFLGGDVVFLGADIYGLVAMLVATVGILALGIFTLEAGVLPRWGGWALIAGNPLVGVVLVLFGLEFLFGAWPVVVPWIVMGFAVFQAAGRRTERPSRVR
jgi:hypothetical protein